MNRTKLLLSLAGLLFLGALALDARSFFATTSSHPPVSDRLPNGHLRRGAPITPEVATATPTLDQTHTVVQPDETPVNGVLPVVLGQPASGKAGPVELTGKLSGAYVKTGPGEAFAVFELSARMPEKTQRVPVNLALVVDRSGSMDGTKLADAKRGAQELVRQLRNGDRLALVHYGSDVKVVPSVVINDATRRELLSTIEAIQVNGGTHMSGGLVAGADAVRPFSTEYRVTRAILLSDGEPTEGTTSNDGLFSLVGKLRETGITVSALGVGSGFNDTLMRGMAERGGGFSGFISDSSELAAIFTRELEQAASTVARNVSMTLTLPPGVSGVEVMGLPSTREGNTVRIPLYDLTGGQSARVVVKLTLDAPANAADMNVLDTAVAYVDVAADLPSKVTLALGAKVTNDAQVVHANLDRDVRVHAIRALGTQQLQAAAEAMKSGDRASALDLLGSARRLFGSSASALAGELADVDQTQAAYGKARSDSDVRDAAISLKKKTMKNFGQNNSY
ncbi:vWA domain-containing protein [Corallococcus carmarthensis]|uniref:VWA domain-containing protein n=1 Tax=Corallococcus carmarthensis TaxID=2316728 RepID=A0A3A8JRB3_9BACT|nr:VWA domain-containing protein [Corallococcus carmarthensis]NOK21704.1 VWA domain-containing protein [Corallococcus carmarthensis]RKG98279.1 VWA domain-containing protein [Corallococcus carmarthensis]